MGGKTAMLVYADDAVVPVLQRTTSTDAGEAAVVVRRLWPECDVQAIDDEEPWALAEGIYPPEGTTCALAVPGLAIVCDQRIVVDQPSELAGHFVAAGTGRRVIYHAMHSVVDWVAFAVWEDEQLVRSLSLAPDFGIIEDLGQRLPFELAYWNGDYPAGEDYPLPFHPLQLGERAMGEFFGFYAEGAMAGDDAPDDQVDSMEIEMHAFRMEDQR